MTSNVEHMDDKLTRWIDADPEAIEQEAAALYEDHRTANPAWATESVILFWKELSEHSKAIWRQTAVGALRRRPQSGMSKDAAEVQDLSTRCRRLLLERLERALDRDPASLMGLDQVEALARVYVLLTGGERP